MFVLQHLLTDLLLLRNYCIYCIPSKIEGVTFVLFVPFLT